VGFLLAIAVATSVNAEFSVGYRYGGAYSGLKGTQGIRTDPATVVGVGYVQITQLDTGATGGDFVAIGTSGIRRAAACFLVARDVGMASRAEPSV